MKATILTAYVGLAGPSATEEQNFDTLVDILDNEFNGGYTLIPCQGRYDGQNEKSIVVRVILTNPTDHKTREALFSALQSYKREAQQQEVYVTQHHEEFWSI